MHKKLVAVIIVFISILAACHKKTSPLKSTAQQAHSETGLASYYADKFNGKPTASGQIYDATKLTAAHRYIPFGTHVKVTNMITGKTITVVVNDRGPFVKDRIIDLSKAAARQLDMISIGIVKVTITY